MKPKYITHKTLAVLIITLSLQGCEKDFLDRQPLDRISSSSVFTDKALTEAYLYQSYHTLNVGYSMYGEVWGDNGIYMLSNLTDEARNKSSWVSSETTIVPGLIKPTDNPLDIWAKSYMSIRIANNIILNLKDAPFEDSYKNRITSEARFIRASLYFYLARCYGGVPLITEPQDIEDQSGMLVARTPQQEVYAFIDKELEEIGGILPSAANLPSDEYGRATREAAWALNGRNLLYAKNYTKSAEYSKKVMDAYLFSLDDDYFALFQSHGGSPEVIFEILFNGVETGHSFDRYNILIPFHIDYASQMNPTQEMVDAYEMENGLPITDPASGYNPDDPFTGRDPRLEATIFYNGSKFRGVTLDMVSPDGAQAPLRTGLSSITGYYIRKFLDEQPIVPQWERSQTSWKELRLGEVLLNYAEAKNEATGPDQSVYDAINSIRARAQMPALPSGLEKDAMKQRIIQERRIELAFENFRWYDLIRWDMAVSVLNDKYFHGMRITRDDSGNLVYNPYLLDFTSKQVFQSKNNLLPIPQDEIEKNPNLTQNPGY